MNIRIEIRSDGRLCVYRADGAPGDLIGVTHLRDAVLATERVTQPEELLKVAYELVERGEQVHAIARRKGA